MKKVFKFELQAVKEYYAAQPTLFIPDTVEAAKRSIQETTLGQSPEWSTPNRRKLVVRSTNAYGSVGTSMTPVGAEPTTSVG